MEMQRFYASRQNAIDNSVILAQTEKQIIYVQENLYDNLKQSEFSLRTIDQVMNPYSDCIVHTQRYDENKFLIN